MGDVVQFRDYQPKKSLEQAVEIINVALMGCPPCEIGSEPVILIYESSLGHVDTSPSEYSAPMDDSA